MTTVATAMAQSSGFALKREQVQLKPSARSSKPMSLRDLEEMRVGGEHVPASKFGLETICGASCDTSAQ